MKSLAFAILAAALLGAAGCSSNDSVGNTDYKPPTQAEVDAQIKAIDEDPNMPPQAKAMRKSMLEKNGTGQKAMPSAK